MHFKINWCFSMLMCYEAIELYEIHFDKTSTWYFEFDLNTVMYLWWILKFLVPVCHPIFSSLDETVHPVYVLLWFCLTGSMFCRYYIWYKVLKTLSFELSCDWIIPRVCISIPISYFHMNCEMNMKHTPFLVCGEGGYTQFIVFMITAHE